MAATEATEAGHLGLGQQDRSGLLVQVELKVKAQVRLIRSLRV